MTDIKNALAQLRAARTSPEAAAILPADVPVENTVPDVIPPAMPTENVPEPSRELAVAGRGDQSRGEVKTLAGRVPLALHRELTRALLDASEQLRVSKINVDEALEAAIRLVLRDAEVTERWHAELRDVRKERREG